MFSLVFGLLCLAVVQSIPIDNGLVGQPEVLCGSQAMLMNFNSEADFEGTLYAKNHFTDDACKGTSDGKRASIELDFNSCGVIRERSLEPPGVFVSAVVVVSFHRTFLTKIDRAIRVRCFYMEADKTVSQELEVSMLTTLLQTITVPMPTCRYEILDGGPDADPVRFTLIGQQVYHKWTCDTDTTDTFCMVVYDCKVDDGTGDIIELLDQEGCALDQYLLGDLEYPTDLMAGREAHVFKYADRANLYFNCQIRLTIKEPGSECPRPQCGRLRQKRNVHLDFIHGASMDVRPQDLMVADVDLTEEDIPAEILHPRRTHAYHPSEPISEGGYCVSQSSLGIGVAVLAVFLLCAGVTAIVVYLNRKH